MPLDWTVVICGAPLEGGEPIFIHAVSEARQRVMKSVSELKEKYLTISSESA